MSSRQWVCDSCGKSHPSIEPWKCPSCGKEVCERCFDRFAHCKNAVKINQAVNLSFRQTAKDGILRFTKIWR